MASTRPIATKFIITRYISVEFYYNELYPNRMKNVQNQRKIAITTLSTDFPYMHFQGTHKGLLILRANHLYCISPKSVKTYGKYGQNTYFLT